MREYVINIYARIKDIALESPLFPESPNGAQLVEIIGFSSGVLLRGRQRESAQHPPVSSAAPRFRDQARTVTSSGIGPVFARGRSRVARPRQSFHVRLQAGMDQSVLFTDGDDIAVALACWGAASSGAEPTRRRA